MKIGKKIGKTKNGLHKPFFVFWSVDNSGDREWLHGFLEWSKMELVSLRVVRSGEPSKMSKYKF